jgi:hypothetical protein
MKSRTLISTLLTLLNYSWKPARTMRLSLVKRLVMMMQTWPCLRMMSLRLTLQALMMAAVEAKRRFWRRYVMQTGDWRVETDKTDEDDIERG